MSKVAGNFTETVLQNIRVRTTEILMDDRISLQYKPTSLKVYEGLRSVQTANLEAILGDPNKERTVEVQWLNNCDIALASVSSCKPTTAPKLSSAKQEYTLTGSSEAPFTVAESDFRTNDYGFEDVVAKGMLSADRLFCEKIQQDAIAVLNAGKGVNARTGGKGVVSGNDTYVATNNWTADLFSYWLTVLAKNRFNGGTLLTGNEALYEASYKALINGGNANGAGDVKAFSGIPTFYDIFNIESANTPEEGETPNISYLLSQGAITFASKPIYSTTVQRAHDHDRFSYKSSFIPDLWINMQVYESCAGNFITKVFKPFVYYDTFVNPTGCDDDNTGILTFICGTPELS